ncbi:MAG: hypothetical protein FWC41_07385 [Firmicutes bacterium]|nr:hypothetical protein [Bacillota bacterium]
MHNITLLCTKHKECGNCNLDELYKIIESISPEIIFEELPYSTFQKLYQENTPTLLLETNAIRKYIQNHKIKVIPVDTYEIENKYSVKKDFDYLFDILYHNNEYRELNELLSLMVNQYGYPYLNSNQCDELFLHIHTIEENIVKHINDEKLSCLYTMWNDIHEIRENEIIKNVYNYSKEHQYNQALQFIGAGHRKSIIEKIEKYEIQADVKLNWTL